MYESPQFGQLSLSVKPHEARWSLKGSWHVLVLNVWDQRGLLMSFRWFWRGFKSNSSGAPPLLIFKIAFLGSSAAKGNKTRHGDLRGGGCETVMGIPKICDKNWFDPAAAIL